MALPFPIKIIKNKCEDLLPFTNIYKPIFIIAPPRSGSTFLFECLIQFKELYHISYEADLIWWRQFPYERMKDPSDFVGSDEASRLNISKHKKAIRSRSVFNMLKLKPRSSILPYFFGRSLRLIDKTIANCFHLEFIDRAFPDAQYIFLLRDPRAVISSMLEGWDHTFKKPQLTPILKTLCNNRINHWSYPAPPGWKEVVQKQLPEICAWSWQKHIEYPLSFFQKKKSDVVIVRYEDLVADPLSSIEKLSKRFALKFSKNVEKYLQSPKLSSTTISKPGPEKWRKNRQNEIESILPQIEKLSTLIGYDFSLPKSSTSIVSKSLL